MASNSRQTRSRLEDEQKRLRQELDQLATAAKNAEPREGSPFGKREEEATESMELEKRLGLENRIGDALTEIEHALQKIDAGTYGLCDVCGKQIPAERLEALPQATLCLDCKAKAAKGRVSPG